MKTITNYLQKHIADVSVFFVFPTQVEADVWAEKALEITDCGSVALERFIAWDRFKESSIKAKVRGRRSISSVVRSLFVYRLLCENAEQPFFEELIPHSFARDFAPFTGFLARLLPALALLKCKLLQKGVRDGEDSDLLALESRYARFLDENDLFEPAWEIPPFDPDGHSYLIFFPEIIEDFDEYEALLGHSSDVRIVRTKEETQDSPPYRFTPVENARDELRLLSRRILHDHLHNGIEFDDIAVHVPGLDLIEPYLLREFSLHSIPIQFRSGKPLAGYAAGSLFTLVRDCVQGGFAAPVLKRLLTQTIFPWKHPELNAELVRFGETNRCDCALEQGDIWLETFRLFPQEERLCAYYEKLKAALQKMSTARSFYEIRAAYFAFRSRFFDTTLFTQNPVLFTARTDAIMSRCVEELSALIQIEQDFPTLVPVLLQEGAPGFFVFFVQVLLQKQYLPREQGRGVHIFAYKAAACAAFKRQYVINASQNEASVVVNPLVFLSREKRQYLGYAEKNCSDSFLALYQAAGELTTFTCAKKTFNGYATPHGSFLTGRAVDPSEQIADEMPAPQDSTNSAKNDLWRMERRWWAATATTDFPGNLFPVQKTGFDRWYALLHGIASKVPQQISQKDGPNFALIQEKISAKKERDNLFRISASDMNTFFTCPLKWLYERIFSIYDPKTVQTMINAQTMGSFYHAIIAQVLENIRSDDKNSQIASGLLDPGRMDDYRILIKQAIQRCAADRRYFAAILPQLVLHSSLDSVQKTLEDFFAFLSTTYAGASVTATERQYQVSFENTAVLVGTVDCILYRDDSWCILDFKKNVLPAAAKYCMEDNSPLEDFQIPLYKRLFEQSENKPQAITQAVFVSIENADKRLVSILGKNPVSSRSRTAYANSEQFETVMNAFDTAAQNFYEAVSTPVPASFERDITFATCAGCSFNTLCRTTYFISGEQSCRLTN